MNKHKHEVDEDLEEKKAFFHYDKQGTVSWWYKTPKESLETSSYTAMGAGCLGTALNSCPTNAEGWFASLWRTDGGKAVDAYFKFLYDEERSPWRSLLTDGYYVDRKNFHYFIPITKTTNHPLLMNFAMANRFSYEYKYGVEYWYELQEKCGLTPNQAWAILSFVFVSKEKSTALYRLPADHYPFHAGYASDIKRIVTGDPIIDSQYSSRNSNASLYRNKKQFYNYGYSPVHMFVNLCWCSQTPKPKSTDEKSLLFIRDAFKYTGSFPLLYKAQTSNTINMLDKDEVIEMVKKNKEKIFDF